jgi:hypothetical protein
MKKMQAVLKRTHSGWSNHLISPYTNKPKEVIKQALREQRKCWNVSGHSFDQPIWFCQPYLPLLIHVGEFRTFIVNGVIYYTVATTPVNLDPTNLELVGARFPRPLDLYKCVTPLIFPSLLPYGAPFRYDSNQPNNPGWLTCDGNDAGLVDPLEYNPDKGYEKYVLDMMGKMVLAEEQQYGVVSGLRLFSRWDVSVFRHEESDKYHYFVSEVTRSWGTCLFHHKADPEGMGDFMFAHLAKLLHHCIATHYLQSPVHL